MLELVGELLRGWNVRRVPPARSDERRAIRPAAALVEREIEDRVTELVEDHPSRGRARDPYLGPVAFDLLARVDADARLRAAHDVHRAVELGEQRS